MSLPEQIVTIAMCVLGTTATRFLPFLVFRDNRPAPPFITYLGRALPSAIFAMLVVYCLRSTEWSSGAHGLPELIGIAVTVVLHRWRHQMLLSIAGGTIVHMMLVQYVF